MVRPREAKPVVESSADAAQTLPSVESLRALGKTLISRSREIEEVRRLPADIADNLAAAGVFRTFVPRCYGGHQRHLLEGLELIEELSYWDSAVGWCSMIGMSTALQSAYLPEEHARRMYGQNPLTVTGGTAEPRGSARLVDGGLVANGRWAWGSGTSHCQWIGGGCRLEAEAGQEGERPQILFVFFESDQVRFHDNWHVGGLRGTGSGDFEVEDAFVPEGRWVERAVDPPLIDDPLYKFPHFGLLALGVTSVGLGLARRAISELKELAQSKHYVGSKRTLAQRPAIQAGVAESEAGVFAARAFIDSAVASAWRSAEVGEMGVEERRRLRLAATFGMSEATKAVDRVYEMGGGSVVYESSPIARLFRDIHVVASHAMVAHRTYELTGRLALGLETNVGQL